MSHEEPSGRSAHHRKLVTVQLEWDVLPPQLALRVHLKDGISPSDVVSDLHAYVETLSEHYKVLGGIGLDYQQKQLKSPSVNGAIRIPLYPVESEDTQIQEQRLLKLIDDVKKRAVCPPPAAVASVDLTVEQVK